MTLIPNPAELQTVRKTPWNSSLPASSEHPHAKAGGGGIGRLRLRRRHERGEERENKTPAVRAEWASPARANADSRREMRRGRVVQTGRASRVRDDVSAGHRQSRAAATSCLGASSTGTDRHRIPTAPRDVSVLRRSHLRPVARRSARTHQRPQADGRRRSPDGRGLSDNLFRQSKSRTSLALLTLFGVPISLLGPNYAGATERSSATV
jgi:hypothetical protein